MHHLPRLIAQSYQGCAAVHWTITMEGKAKGWLDAAFHACFRQLLLHAAAREHLTCPTYVLMPDHMHLLWMGMGSSSDQRRAMRFVRKYLGRELARRSPGGVEFELQEQSHDSVLRSHDRTRGALAKVCFYILNNPCRAELVTRPWEWPFLGAVIPGFPFLHPLEDEFWLMFWKLYYRYREPTPDAVPPSDTDEIAGMDGSEA